MTPKTLSSLVVLSALASLVAGCAKESRDQSESAPVSSAAAVLPPASPAALAAVVPGAPRYDEEAFEVTLHAPNEAKVGEGIPVSVVLVAKAGFKVNPEYPIKFAFEESAELVSEPKVLRKEQGTLEKTRAELRGVVTPRAAGARVVAGKLSFSVCTDERCLIEKRDLALTVTAL